jgi:hypothetical protein
LNVCTAVYSSCIRKYFPQRIILKWFRCSHHRTGLPGQFSTYCLSIVGT